jgi:C-terminal processing protease CtpA/Prc
MLIGLCALVLIAAIPAIAGGHGKCKYNTQECLDKMAAKLKDSGWLGLELDYKKETKTLYVEKVIPGSPAEKAGMKPGDVIHALNGVKHSEKNKAMKMEWGKLAPGKQATFTIARKGKEKVVQLTPTSMPADVLAKWIGEHMVGHATVEVAAK